MAAEAPLATSACTVPPIVSLARRLRAERATVSTADSPAFAALGMLAVVSMLALLGTMGLRAIWPHGVPVLGIWALAMWGAVLFRWRAYEARFGARGPLVAATLLVALGPMLTVLARIGAEEVVAVGGAFSHESNPHILLAIVALAAAYVVSSLVESRAGKFQWPRAGRALLAMSRAAIVLSLVAAGWAAVRRAHHPEPDQWLASLPTLRPIEDDDWQKGTDLAENNADPRSPQVRRRVDAVEVAGFALRRVCSEGHCSLYCPRGGFNECAAYGVDGWLRARALPDGRALLILGEQPYQAALALGRDGMPRRITLAEVRAQLAPPVAWTIFAVLGCITAVTLLVVGRFWEAKLPLSMVRAAEVVDARHCLIEGVAVPLPEGFDAPAGTRFTALLSGPLTIETHRSAGTTHALALYPGEPELLHARIAVRAVTREMMALAAVSVMAAPLWACVAMRLAM